MSILVYTDHIKGAIKRATYESLAFAKQFSQGAEINVIAIGNLDQGQLAELGKYGANKVYLVNQPESHQFDSQVYAKVIADVADKKSANKIIFAHTSSGKSLAPRVSVRLNAGLVSGVIGINENGSFRKGVFSAVLFLVVLCHNCSSIMRRQARLRPGVY